MSIEYVEDLYVVEGYIDGDETEINFSIKLEKTETTLTVKIVDDEGFNILAPSNIEVLLSNNSIIVIEEGTSQTVINIGEPSKISSITSANIMELDLDITEITIDGKVIKLSEIDTDINNKKNITIEGGTFDENIKITLNTGENIYIIKGRTEKVIVVPKKENTTIQKISGDEITDVIPEINSEGEFSTIVARKPLTIYFLTDTDTPIGALGLSTDDLIVDKANQSEVFTMVAPSDDLVSFNDIKASLPLKKRELITDDNGKKVNTYTTVKAFEDIEIDKFDMDKIQLDSKYIEKLEVKHTKAAIAREVNISKVKKSQKRITTVAKITESAIAKKDTETNNAIIIELNKKLARAELLRLRLEKMIEDLMRLLNF